MEEGSHRCALTPYTTTCASETNTNCPAPSSRKGHLLPRLPGLSHFFSGWEHACAGEMEGLWSDLEEKPICQLIWISRTQYRAVGQPPPNTGAAEPGHLAFACQWRHCTQQQSQTISPFRSLPALEIRESSFFPHSRGSQPGADGIFILLMDNMAAQQYQGDGVSKAASSK